MINIPNSLSESERNLYIAAYNRCVELQDKDFAQSISDIVEQVVSVFSAVGINKESLRNFLFEEISADIEPVINIVSNEMKDSDWWKRLRKTDGFKTEYWTRYFDCLYKKDNWSINAVRDIDEATDDVMNVISNAYEHNSEERMGLVFGYVQSGKTAHYIGLINKAIDAGYKIIIVLSGIHNNLRSQTQARIDEEVLGYETSLQAQGNYTHAKNAIGVGIGKSNQITESTLYQSLTTRDEKGDFNIKVAGTSMHPPYIIVTKKNAAVLRKLIAYFQKSPIAESDGKQKKIIPSEYPVLIIDDEADQASLNTNECFDNTGKLLDNYNPTTINGLIREMLRLFECRSYVGYTATPFANIFIPPHMQDNKFGSDLYPKDFILKIPRADKYIGAREFFGLTGEDEAPAMPLCRDIVEGKSYLGKGTKSTDPVGEIPAELKQAIKCFFISTALRNLRGQRNKPNTMLIHIVRFVAQQNKIKRKIAEYVKEELENFVLYGDSDIEISFREIWENDYQQTTLEMQNEFPKYAGEILEFEWATVYQEIKRLFSEKEFVIYSVNGKSMDSLMYKDHAGQAFNVIAIGGDKLSRGLTLEGLTVSYFTRSSNTYDTLMQMGRWFGYRPGYLDLCRLYTTPLLKNYFLHISMATEELVHQFDFMNDMDQTPMSFGLRIATHPDLLISSRNKVRTGKEMKKDFSNRLSQTRSFDVNPEQYDTNFAAAEILLKAIGAPQNKELYWQEKNRPAVGEHIFWSRVAGFDIANFLEDYQTSENATRANSQYMADYIRNQNKCGGLTNWTVCLINVGNGPKFSIANLEIGSGIEREKGITDDDRFCSIHTMTSAGHEYLDYTSAQMNQVEAIKNTHSLGDEKTLAEYIRKSTRKRENGLLILYPIGQAGSLTKSKGTHKTPFGFAVVFPHRQGLGNLQSYRVTEIAIERENYELYE
ncbi:MAG: Z1 domain-containing protein [Anaerovoracaceae bacterium]